MKQNFSGSGFFGSLLHYNRKKLAVFVLSVLLFGLILNIKLSQLVYANSPGSVVINEIAWAGSADSSTDEWIELYNTSSQSIDLTDWYIDDDNGSSKYEILSGTIPAHGYFLIEDHESAVNTITSDAIADISLANTGDSLKLYDDNNQLIDTVNSSGGAWASGNSTTKATMERIDPLASGDLTSNWGVSTGSGEKSSGNSDIIGTPKKINSVSSAQVESQKIDIAFSPINPKVGDTLTATIKATNVTNLFAYGFDLSYDANILQYKTVSQLGFLSENSTKPTSFQGGLENGTAGKLVIAEARTAAIKTGVSGSGDLLKIEFEVLNNSLTPSTLHFGSNSFLADPSTDMGAQFIDKTFTIEENTQIDPISNLQITEGQERYSLALSWTASPNANAYKVLRKDAHGQWKLLGEIPGLNFIDKDGTTGGGYIVPKQQYAYQVIAKNGTDESSPLEGSQKDNRGLKGDNNRSDRVDGRDLQELAKHFGETDNEIAFNPLVDTTYDGNINGSDLIDLGANFALTYTP